MNAVGQAYQRATSPTPPFWRKVRNIGGALGIVAIVLSKMPVISEEWRQVCREVGEYLLTVAGTAQFTTTNRALSEKK